MKYDFQFYPYRRQFKHPLKTSHGIWKVREGIVVRLTDTNGCVGFGEIAPLEWFGSESFAQALDFCTHLPSKITADDVFAIPSTLPACQFGFESAWENVTTEISFQETQAICCSGLLPSGTAALDGWKELWSQGYRTFKWKIGVEPIADEMRIFYELTKILPSEAKLRLDANGGLGVEEAVEWLKSCDRIGVEFLEQPLPVTQFDAMLSLNQQCTTLIALDESVTNLKQLIDCYQQGWRGVFVIKPAIAGSPKLLRQICQKYKLNTVFSSVLETVIGKNFGLRLSNELSQNGYAPGFGVEHWFPEDNFLSQLAAAGFLPHELCK